MLHSGTIITLILLSISFLIALIFTSWKFFRNKKIVKLILIFSLISFSASSFELVHHIFKKNRLYADIKESSQVLGELFYDRYPLLIGNSMYIISSIKNNDKYASYNDNRALNDNVKKESEGYSPTIILVLGESSYNGRYSSYGYEKITTPNIQRIFSANNGGCIVNDAISPAPITRDSLAITLSFISPDNNNKLFNEKSIIDMAGDNGYKTYWLSSQNINGLYSSKYGYIAKQSDVVEFSDWSDDKLPEMLDSTLNENSDKKFIVIHLHGSHLPYKNFDNTDAEALKSDDYDLTIHHTDRVINEIYQVAGRKTGSFVILYTSDHGEIVGEGHGLRKGKEQYEIPLMAVSNNSQSNTCDLIESYRNNNGYLNGNSNKYIISELIGYSVDPASKQKTKNDNSILTANEDVIDYDEYKKLK
ncbi:phosphoethanolamine transferase [Providencia hangzhouensis]|uniref:phosphoethanolamine transferase n=1 Tax=Providencia hangzhouensis TaxID=3031799 RepID=UPI0034DDA3AC